MPASIEPTASPTASPTAQPTVSPTAQPTKSPTTRTIKSRSTAKPEPSAGCDCGKDEFCNHDEEGEKCESCEDFEDPEHCMDDGLPKKGMQECITRCFVTTAKPGTAKPGTAKPGTAKPGTAKPGTAKPGTVKPGTVKPGTVKPEPVKTTTPTASPTNSPTEKSVSVCACEKDEFCNHDPEDAECEHCEDFGAPEDCEDEELPEKGEAECKARCFVTTKKPVTKMPETEAPTPTPTNAPTNPQTSSPTGGKPTTVMKGSITKEKKPFENNQLTPGTFEIKLPKTPMFKVTIGKKNEIEVDMKDLKAPKRRRRNEEGFTWDQILCESVNSFVSRMASNKTMDAARLKRTADRVRDGCLEKLAKGDKDMPARWLRQCAGYASLIGQATEQGYEKVSRDFVNWASQGSHNEENCGRTVNMMNDLVENKQALSDITVKNDHFYKAPGFRRLKQMFPMLTGLISAASVTLAGQIGTHFAETCRSFGKNNKFLVR